MSNTKISPTSPLVRYLTGIFESRKIRNSRYSLRAFARDLGLSAGKLSDILNQKYSPGEIITKRISDSLQLSDDETAVLQVYAHKHEAIVFQTLGTRILAEDEVLMIVDYRYYSMMSLMEIKGFRSDLSWISKKIGASRNEVLDILDRLLKLKLIEFKNNEYRLTHKRITTSHNIPSEALKDAHRNIIDHAKACLSSVPVDLRDITSITFPVNTTKMMEAKNILRDCRRKMADLFGDDDNNEVYNLNIQFVPVTQLAKEVQ